MHQIRMGVPEMAALWKDLTERHDQHRLNKVEEQSFKRLVLDVRT